MDSGGDSELCSIFTFCQVWPWDPHGHRADSPSHGLSDPLGPPGPERKTMCDLESRTDPYYGCPPNQEKGPVAVAHSSSPSQTACLLPWGKARKRLEVSSQSFSTCGNSIFRTWQKYRKGCFPSPPPCELKVS